MFQRFARRAKIAYFSSDATGRGGKARALAAVIVLVGLGLGGCAQQPQQIAAAGHPKEYFPSSIYGRASRRVVEDGQPIPRGGGQYLVGKPYTVAGQTYYPSERRVTQIGLASWYGDAFHGRLTANGEIYDRDAFTAAHPTMPLPSYARVTNLRNSTSMIVRVNDRGPYHSNRVMDVSRRVAEALDIRRTGTAKVKVEWVGRASLAGSDDAKLAATLRTDGPARLQGVEESVMIAAATSPARIASVESIYPRVHTADTEEAAAEPSVTQPRHQAARHKAAPSVESEADDGEEKHARRLETRSHDDADEDSTGSLSRSRHGRIAETRHEISPRLARLEFPSKSRDARERAAKPVPGLRHASLAPERVLPPPRPSHVAAVVLPQARPHAIGLRMTRSHYD